MERALLDRPANYDHDYDGRPSVLHGFDGDPLLEALIREHPELIPAELVALQRAHMEGMSSEFGKIRDHH